MKPVMVIMQVLLMMALAPLLSGLIRKIKNGLRMRKGAPVMQPYYDLFRLMRKDEVVSENASWIFRVTPLIVLGSVVAALAVVPAMPGAASFGMMGEMVLIVFLLAMGRFFTALAGLDTGSAFGGMGSSRDMFISSLAEPVMLLSVFAVSLTCGSTSSAALASRCPVHISAFIAAFAFSIVMAAETSRIPIDNRETHLELTMVHEAMALEYSGRSLALLELSSHLKQILFFTILASVLIPFGVCPVSGGIFAIIIGAALYPVKLAAIAVAVAAVEVSIAKMRLFRVVDLMSFALVIAIMAVVSAVIGF